MFLPSKQQQMEDPPQALRMARILWAALCMGVVFFGVVIVFLTQSAADEARTSTQGECPFFYVACVIAVVAVIGGLIVRRLIFKSATSEGVVNPQGYMTGNIIAWAACEGAAFAGIIFCLVDGKLMPTILPPVVPFAVLLLLWPTGRAMFSVPPDAQTDRYRDA